MMIRTLLFSTLYPSSTRPSHGIFVETRLRHLLASQQVATRVIAPVPWFPLQHGMFGKYASLAAVPRCEEHNGISVDHPRYFLLPKIGMAQVPYTLARAGLAAAKRLIAGGYDFDLIDAHYFYPDGVAAALIGSALDKPVVITARGSDINLISRYAQPRRRIVDAARQAAGIIAVSSALREAMMDLGIDGEKIRVLGNGVDSELFYQEDRSRALTRWAANGYVLASVGNLVPTKGHDLVIRAVAAIPDSFLFIAGQGPEHRRLSNLAASLGVSDRVRLVGLLAQEDLRSLYSAADCLVLASIREGCPNVVLEAMACGATVLANRVGGVAEMLAGSVSGHLLESRDPAQIVKTIKLLRANPEPRAAACAHAARHSWKTTTAGQLSLFRSATGVSHA